MNKFWRYANSVRKLKCFLLVIIAAGWSANAAAQFVQQGQKLIGIGVAGSLPGQQGYQVALSADGNTAIVGSPIDGDRAGAAWVLIRNGSIWSQQGPKLVGTGAVRGSDGSQQGTSVAISADGNTAIVGGPGDNRYAGAVWIFTRSNGVWSQQGNKLVAPIASTNPVYFGSAVAISGDGNTVIAAGNDYSNSPLIGGAWIFTRNGGLWSQQGGTLLGTDAVGEPGQGASLALSADGNTAIVGGPEDGQSVGNNFAIGAAWVFTRSNGMWSQEGSKLVGSGAVGYARQGTSVALSADGNTAIIGGPDDDNSRSGIPAGAAWVFTRSGGIWSQQGNKLIGTNDYGEGRSSALSADGNIALLGGDNFIRVFTRSGNVWTRQGTDLHGSGAAGFSAQGTSVSLSADGTTVATGGPGLSGILCVRP